MAITVELELEPLTCADCGIPFAIPAALVTVLRQNHRDFHCPHGHAQSFPAKTEADVLRAKLHSAELQLAEVARRRARTAKAREAASRKLRAVS